MDEPDFDDSGEDSPPTSSGIQFFVPPEQEGGTYANTFAIWNTPYDLVFDFGVIQLAQPDDPTDPDSPQVVPARVVQRILLPSTLIFEFVTTINAVMDSYEQQWGPINHPEPRRPEGPEEWPRSRFQAVRSKRRRCRCPSTIGR